MNGGGASFLRSCSECGSTEWQLQQTKWGKVYAYMCADCGYTDGE